MPGFVLLDKEAGETSFKALFPLKRVFCTKRVGHAGTLDLRASGLIIAATGRATRLLPYVEAKEKCYSFRLHLGYETDTLEWDGDVLEQDERRETRDERVLDREDVERVLSQFVGDIEQIPPKYCAVKINGVRASDLMERGRNVELKPRKIHIESLELLGEADGADPTCTGKCMAAFDLVCVCSKGTYIRALGRDIGRALGTFGCVSRIRRLRIGHVTLDRAVKGADLTAADLVPVDQVLEFPVVRMGDAELASIRNGNWIPWKAPVENVGPEGRVFAANRDGEVLSLCKYEPGRILADVYLAEDG
ncbi:MAG: tRNA pseudouridine(55) synthase TruB [Fibrobacter sp.]|nr:tRNA pseudouridine(55) synthase TruB [Fibrobacter sp.]